MSTKAKKRTIPSLIRKKNNLICAGLNNHFNPLKIALEAQIKDILSALMVFLNAMVRVLKSLLKSS